jgi:hypothetical protein
LFDCRSGASEIVDHYSHVLLLRLIVISDSLAMVLRQV